MGKNITLLLALLLGCNAWGQNTFPAAWAGLWAGNLQVVSATGNQEVPVTFEVAKQTPTKYTWKFTFNASTGPVVKDYTLLVDTALAGHYIIDEGDGILLDAYLFAQKLYCTFDVEGRLFFTSYELQNDNLIFEIIYGPFAKHATTGGGKVDGEDVPTIGVYQTQGLQKAVLKRKM